VSAGDRPGHYEADLGPCPACGAETDCHAPAYEDDGAGPTPGSVLVCFYCGALAMVGEDGRQRHPTPRERSALLHDPNVVQARGAMLRSIADRRRGSGAL
jgi:hypothetical protein